MTASSFNYTPGLPILISHDMVNWTLAGYARAGVTWLRDGGDNLGVSLLAAEIAPDYGITVLSPAFPIYKKGRYGRFLGRSWETMADYRALVSEAKQAGASYIKLFLTGICSFAEYGKVTSEPVGPEEMRQLVSVAHGEGLPVMAHVSGREAILWAAQAGVDSLEHG